MEMLLRILDDGDAAWLPASFFCTVCELCSVFSVCTVATMPCNVMSQGGHVNVVDLAGFCVCSILCMVYVRLRDRECLVDNITK